MFKFNLKTIRKKWGFTQQNLADLLGVKRSVIAQYEVGTNNPSINTLIQLENFTSIPIKTLWVTKIELHQVPDNPIKPMPVQAAPTTETLGQHKSLEDPNQ